MLVEFVGGSLDGTEKRIERFFEYINTDHDVYYARAIRYKQLGWIYVWYESAGRFKEMKSAQTHHIY